MAPDNRSTGLSPVLVLQFQQWHVEAALWSRNHFQTPFSPFLRKQADKINIESGNMRALFWPLFVTFFLKTPIKRLTS
jgi:hypothetical protein